MENLNNYSELAEIFSATTIVFGSIFALVQFREWVEWVEWLVNQVESEERTVVPAYIAHNDWKHK